METLTDFKMVASVPNANPGLLRPTAIVTKFLGSPSLSSKSPKAYKKGTKPEQSAMKRSATENMERILNSKMRAIPTEIETPQTGNGKPVQALARGFCLPCCFWYLSFVLPSFPPLPMLFLKLSSEKSSFLQDPFSVRTLGMRVTLRMATSCFQGVTLSILGQYPSLVIHDGKEIPGAVTCCTSLSVWWCLTPLLHMTSSEEGCFAKILILLKLEIHEGIAPRKLSDGRIKCSISFVRKCHSVLPVHLSAGFQLAFGRHRSGRAHTCHGIMDDSLPNVSFTQETKDIVHEAVNMSFFERISWAWKILFPTKPKRSSNAEIAKQRLKMILFSDRCAVNDEAKRKIVDNIVGALSDFVEIDSEDKVQLNVSADPDLGTVYSVTVPVRRVKPEYQEYSGRLRDLRNIEYKDAGGEVRAVDIFLDYPSPNDGQA
eukprot:Gb_33417 [translate_table: standard]